jgi:hypothetical protein
VAVADDRRLDEHLVADAGLRREAPAVHERGQGLDLDSLGHEQQRTVNGTP